MSSGGERDSGGLLIADDGWLVGGHRVASPNCDKRPVPGAIELIVIHAISLPPDSFGGEDVDRLFTNTLNTSAHPFFKSLVDLRVSAHFLVARDGRVTQYVSCLERAWHAGVSAWRGKSRCNDYSIGIELEGSDTQAFSDRQYAVLGALVDALRVRYPVRDVVGHAHIAPGRKTDPGPYFDWRRCGWNVSPGNSGVD